jgi:hypothetical protein
MKRFVAAVLLMGFVLGLLIACGGGSDSTPVTGGTTSGATVKLSASSNAQ